LRTVLQVDLALLGYQTGNAVDRIFVASIDVFNSVFMSVELTKKTATCC